MDFSPASAAVHKSSPLSSLEESRAPVRPPALPLGEELSEYRGGTGSEDSQSAGLLSRTAVRIGAEA